MGTPYLEARPSLTYTTPGGSRTITCYNVSTNAPSRNSQWYKINSNGTLQQLSTEVDARIRNDGSQLRISYVRREDNGSYCCKGTTEGLEGCNERATGHIIVVIPPVITAHKQNQTVLVGNNATLECVIEYEGNPPFVVFRWQKSNRRLMTYRTKYVSQLIGNRMFLTIVNSTTDDEGSYQCIVETSVFQRRKAFVGLYLNHRVNHAGLDVTNGK